MRNNLQNFPRNYFEKRIECFIPSTAKAGQIFYFNPDSVIDASQVIGLQFLPLNGYIVDNTTPGYTQANSTQASNVLITLVNKNTEQIFMDYPVNGLGNQMLTNPSNVQKVVRIFNTLNTKKCFLKITSDATTNLKFLFSIYYKKI